MWRCGGVKVGIGEMHKWTMGKCSIEISKMYYIFSAEWNIMARSVT